MKVHEMIEALQKLSPDLTVCIKRTNPRSDVSDALTVKEVSEPFMGIELACVIISDEQDPNDT